MKAYLYTFLFLVFLINGCNDKKNTPADNKKRSTRIKDNEHIDYAAKGLVNLDASSEMKDIICQSWEYSEDADDAQDADPLSAIDMVYRGYSLFTDGSMIKDPRGNMLTGKWSVDEKAKPIIVSFFLNNGTTEKFKLAHLDAYEMKLSKEGEKKIIELAAEGTRHINLDKDPFYISNNRWRFMPADPETDDQVKQRLKDCIRFFILFYEQKIDFHSDRVSFIGLPSCFKWYGGGIYLQKQIELQTKWVSTYYNKEQAMKAYKLADRLLSFKYEWPKGESNWLKLNLAVLKQMEKKLDTL